MAGTHPVLDAALSGGPHDTAAGRLTLWVGGDEAVAEEMRPVLGSYASPVMLVGLAGNGQPVKLVNNALFVAQGSRLIERMLRLPPPLTRDLAVERDLPVPMRDGAVLLADRWAPRSADGLPAAQLRIPYGRAGLIAAQMARPLAERGFPVLVQSTRGTFGSGGAFDPLRSEREDGLDT